MRRFLPALLLLPVLFGSCSHQYYAPNLHNVPLFRERGEVRVAVSGVTANEMSGSDVQVAGSVTDHIGLMVNTMTMRGGDRSQLDDYGRGHIIEGGIGYFGTLEDRWAWEVYGGYGRGKVKNIYDYGANSEMDLSRVFIQPAVGMTHDVFNFAASMRVSNLMYDNIRSFGLDTTYLEDDLRDVTNIMENKSSLLIEPAIHIRVGYKYAKFAAQFSFSSNMSNPDLQMSHFVFGAGLQFHFARYFQDKKSTTAR